ncbi:MAG: helix-turn-helix domain-containing protein [Xanthomonadaceae bacterium]|nr:helix-turn-helix domain-containing protein [Xanthomonadaceae bacterium]
MTWDNRTPDLTPRNVRAARALLAWSQKDLAEAAGVATSTVADFERGRRTPVANNAEAMRGALEDAGVQFLPKGAVIGPDVPGIAPTERPGAPVRWVTAEDLSNWANQIDGASSLPTLISHLIRATHGAAVSLRFPADEGVRYSGWDGVSSTETGSEYVPAGETGWEIGSQRSKIAQKATEDYRKRMADPGALDPANAAFVFVTPRHWPAKDNWARDCQDEGVWREVRAYDAEDLVHWIEQTPAIGLWLASLLNKRPDGTRELDDFWQEWSLATQWLLTEELVLSDRDQDAVEVLRWLRGEPSVLALQSSTTEEVVAFFHATLGMLPDDVAAAYRTRCLVTTTADGARALVNAPAPLYLIMTERKAGLARFLVEHGHYVLQAHDERPVARGNIRTLARPSREGIGHALTTMGIAEPRAEALARDCARNLSILRRIIPGAPGRSPQWAENSPRALLAALLAGGWDEDSDADRARLAQLADQPYTTVIADLARYVDEFDQPLRKIGSTWRIASPPDAWFLLAQYLTSADVARFEAAAHDVLGSADPRFEMDPDERWMAAVQGVHPEYSAWLRHGIGQVLILLALWGDQARMVPDAARRADAIVEKLLRDADSRRWWSLSRDFRLLAEASPRAFLDAIEDSLDQDEPPIRALFDTDGEAVFGTEHLSDMLWALESLAWSPELMPRVSPVLARLDAIDKPPGKYANRPANSLREVHILWNPQTHATLNQRLRVLDLIRNEESDAAWKLMLGILPGDRDTSTPSPIPRWRDFTVDEPEVVTWGLIRRGAVEITQRLIADAGTDASRWSSLLDRFADLAPDPEAAFVALEAAERKITGQVDRHELWEKLRRVLHHHRQFPDAEWSLPDEVIDRLEVLYERFTPEDPIERVAWLFEMSAVLPKPSSPGWETKERDIDEARRQAALMVFSEGGVAAVLGLARLVKTAGLIGKALYEVGLSDSELDSLLEAAFRSGHEREPDVAHGLIVAAYREGKEPWAEALIDRAKDEDWGETALLTILRALPPRRWTWDQVAEAGPEIEDAYWRKVPSFRMGDNGDDMAFAIHKFISVNRARHALALAEGGSKQLATALLVEVLQEAQRQPFESNGAINETSMFQYYVTEILQTLDERDDLDEDALVKLEWAYLPLLEHSSRPARVLPKALSKQPALFVELLRAVFKTSEESGDVEPEPENPEQARAFARQAHRLLRNWSHLPGTRDDGSIDGDALESWIKEARSLAKAAGRVEIADDQIGNVLSASPDGADGNWPAEAVREALDRFRSKPMLRGFCRGKINRRGVTTRMPRDGGRLERQEAAKYREWAKAMRYKHPYTAKALDRLAQHYEDDARRHDEDAERLDWQY